MATDNSLQIGNLSSSVMRRGLHDTCTIKGSTITTNFLEESGLTRDQKKRKLQDVYATRSC